MPRTSTRLKTNMALVSKDQQKFLRNKVDQRLHLFGVIKVSCHWQSTKGLLVTAGTCHLYPPSLKRHLESKLYLKIKSILKMAPSRFTSGLAVKNRKSLLMIDFLLSIYTRELKMDYMLPVFLLKEHGGELC